MSRVQRMIEWLPALIRRLTGVNEQTSRLAALVIAVVFISCAAQATADVVSSIAQTVQLEHDNAVARRGYIARTNAIIANHETIIHNESILCQVAKRTDCIASVARPAER